MKACAEAPGSARSDYDIFGGIARQMGVWDAFTEGRTSEEWVRHLYDHSRQNAAEKGIEIPTFPDLERKGWFEVDPPAEPDVILRDFRADPNRYPLKTPSGKIEIWSEEIAGFVYDDCPAHPTWQEPAEWLGKVDRYPLHLISNQPKDKLHSQLDHGSVSRSGKKNGREPMTIHPDDAAARGIGEGDAVRVFNDRGACYCSARLSDAIRPGVIQISTGAWFDPDETGACKHGNPNVLTLDKGGSRLAQGPIAHSCLVDVETADNPPDVTAFDPPKIIRKMT